MRRRYGNGLQFLALKRANIVPCALIPCPPLPPYLLLQMHRPRSLDLPAHGLVWIVSSLDPEASTHPSRSPSPRKNLHSPRVLSSPLNKRGRWPQQYLMKFISRKIAHGRSKSKFVIHTIRRRLLLTSRVVQRGLNFPRTPRTPSTPSGSDAWETTQPERAINSPILLPQLPLLCLGPASPDSGYCSDESRSPPSSPQSDIPPRPIRRYILPDRCPAASPSDLVSTAEIQIRLSGQPTLPRIPHSS
ncbi:hypothetical protein FB451DRAFT_1223286 [Mycena latifolia]|nr:hypothetical protein FB451DRAFT_1223286 [Mycena latifolia]